MDYYCAVCEKEAKVVDGLVLRSCEHADSAVFAPRTSVLYGDGVAGEKSLAAAAIDPIASNVKQVNDLDIDGAGTSGDPWKPA